MLSVCHSPAKWADMKGEGRYHFGPESHADCKGNLRDRDWN